MKLPTRIFLAVAAGHFALSYFLFAFGPDQFIRHLYPDQPEGAGFLASLLVQPFWGPRALLPLPVDMLLYGKASVAPALLSLTWGLVAAVPFAIARRLVAASPSASEVPSGTQAA